MSDRANQRFEEFRRQYLAGENVDPREFLAGFEGDDRAELSLLIEHFLIEQPARAWDEEEFHRTGAAEVAERVTAEIMAELDTGPERLTDLRTAAQITREAVVARLAGELELTGETESVGFYYHHMERGTLPTKGVSESVFVALSRVLKVSVDRLRRAAEASQRDFGPGEPVFARAVTGTQPVLEATEADSVMFTSPDKRGEVDRLFTGG